ncbi:hypothetical protein mRhiFer1_009564 [Rhinolophus ferrumequinum]|uniref:Uncharacterized protein n=1 Tax=Rhinolophus ferrumequinum TaxID=59479 RepID=A0A7J7ZQH8_RHIFE|nr:hypothetical protein mRhiFer1_009564 [Rhinolophus ferrumequinum]
MMWSPHLHLGTFRCPLPCSRRVLICQVATQCHFLREAPSVTTVTKYLSLGGLNNRNLFCQVLEAGRSKSRNQEPWLLRRTAGGCVRILSLLACRWPSSCSRWCSPRGWLCVQMSPLYKQTRHIGLGPALITSS